MPETGYSPPERFGLDGPGSKPTVWTERMLTALEQGVKGGKWFSLMDKVYALPNLQQAFARVKANQGAAGVDQVTVEEFERHLEANLEKLSRALAGRQLSTASGAAGLDHQAGQQGTTPAGDSDGARPGGADGAASSAGTDLRAGLRGAELRVPSESGLQGRAAPGRYAAEARLHAGWWMRI